MIRHATAADLPAIADLHVASWRAAYRGLLSDKYLDGPLLDLRQGWATMDPARLVLVDDMNGRLRAFAALWPDHVDGAYLDNLHVAPELRGTGVGKDVLRACLDAVSVRGKSALWLSVMAQNVAARRFYAALGGQEEETFVEWFDGQPVDMLHVRWSGF